MKLLILFCPWTFNLWIKSAITTRVPQHQYQGYEFLLVQKLTRRNSFHTRFRRYLVPNIFPWQQGHFKNFLLLPKIYWIHLPQLRFKCFDSFKTFNNSFHKNYFSAPNAFRLISSHFIAFCTKSLCKKCSNGTLKWAHPPMHPETHLFFSLPHY